MIKQSIFLAIFLLLVSAVAYAAPQVSSVSITNTAPVVTNDNLICQFTLNSTAAESVWANVTWYKDSVANTTVQKGPVTSAQTVSDILSNSKTTKGETWSCSVKGYNATDEIAAVASNSVLIANTNVTLSDITAQTYVKGSGIKELSLSSFAVDPDTADTITFSATSVDASKISCGTSSNSLTFASVGNFTGTGYCNVTAYDGTYITAPKTVTITVRDQQTLLSVPSSVYLGSTSGQERNKSVTGSFALSNPGTAGDKTITGIEVSTNAASKYLVNFSLDNTNFQSTVSGFSLAPGESKTVYYKGFVPLDVSSGTTDIGDITVKSNEVTKTVTAFYTNTPMMLTIFEINANVDGNSDGSIAVAGDDIDEKAAPGSVVKLEIKLENEFSDSSDIDLENVKITAEIEGMETDLDVDEEDDAFEEETSEFKIRSDSKSDWKYLTFNIPYDAEEGTYDINIEAVGTDDEYGAEHKASTTLTLEVEREDHLIKIIKAKLGSEEITCKDYTTLNVLIQNIGNDDEDETVLTVKNAALGLAYTSSEMELVEDPADDESEFSKVFTIDLSGKEIAAGVYPIEISTFYSGDIISDTKTVSLTVTCEAEKAAEETVTEDETVVLQEEAAKDTAAEGGAVAQEVYETTETEEKGFFGGNTGYTVLLILANVIIIIVALFLVFKFLIAPKN